MILCPDQYRPVAAVDVCVGGCRRVWLCVTGDAEPRASKHRDFVRALPDRDRIG